MPCGAFDGVIALSSEEAYWLRVYKAVASARDSSVSLIRAEGDFLVRFPPLGPEGANASQTFLRAIQEADQGIFELTSRVDGVRRIIGYKKLPGHAVYVVYTLNADALRSVWRNHSLVLALLAAAAIGVLLGLTLLLRRRMESEARLRRALATANGELESRVLSRTQELTRALHDKDVLLKEVHHRVKNNLAMIAGMVGHAARSAPPEARARLSDVRNRIVAVGRAYDAVYRADDLKHIDLATYLAGIGESMRSGAGRQEVALRFRTEPCVVDIDTAMPVGIVAQELIMNAYKHAFPEGRAGTITITLECRGGQGVLTVADDGAGGGKAHAGGGLKLAEMIARQADGVLRQHAVGAGGTSWELRFEIGGRKAEGAQQAAASQPER